MFDLVYAALDNIIMLGGNSYCAFALCL